MLEYCKHFFAMGGYGIYIWPAYGLAFATLMVNLVWPWCKHRALIKKLRRGKKN